MHKPVCCRTMNACRKIAVISCESDDQKLLKFRGKRLHTREIVSIRMKELGLEPIIYRPVKDIKDFPDHREVGSVLVGGSSFFVFDKDLSRNEWMRKLLDFIREVHGKVPLLGLCFGHQVIGRAFGADLKMFGPGITYEVGFVPVRLTKDALNDPLFAGLPKRFPALFSHYSYLSSLPEKATLLLTPTRPNNPSIQGFRIEESTWGIQYHPEYTPELVRDLVLRDREKLNEKMDVKAALQRLNVRKRTDEIPLGNFAKFVCSF